MYPVLFHIGPLLIPSYGVMAALGVLCALALCVGTARLAGVNPNLVWNLCIVALFAGLAGSRLLLIAVNWAVVRAHPAWVLSLAMVHHPLLAVADAAFASAAALLYARVKRMPMRATADALAAPLALGLACEQLGALMAGSGFGTETTVPWAVVFTNPLAERWSGAPLGVALHPVQAYAALAFLIIAVGLLLAMPRCVQHGDAAGIFLMAMGAAIYLTELWRDPQGRGAILQGLLDGPQIGAITMVLAGSWLLRRKEDARIARKPVSAEIRQNEQAGEEKA